MGGGEGRGGKRELLVCSENPVVNDIMDVKYYEQGGERNVSIKKVFYVGRQEAVGNTTSSLFLEQVFFFEKLFQECL